MTTSLGGSNRLSPCQSRLTARKGYRHANLAWRLEKAIAMPISPDGSIYGIRRIASEPHIDDCEQAPNIYMGCRCCMAHFLKVEIQKWVIACVDKVGGGKQHQNRHQNDASVIADSRNFVCELNSQLLWQIRRTDDRNDE